MLFLTLKRRGRSRPWTKGWAIAAAMFALLSVLTQGSRAENAANASSNATSVATVLTTMRTTTSEQDDASDFLKELKEMMARSFANMPTSLRRKMLEAEVRPECSIALMRTIRAFLNFEPWALKLFDASGKYPTGLFQGSHADLGAFDECLETVLRDSYGNVMARGQYCNLLVYSKNGTATESAILSVPDVLHPRIKYFSNYVTAKDYPLLRMAICFTDECNQQDFQALVNVVKTPLVRLEVSNCVTADPEPWTYAQIAIAIFLCFLLVVVTAGTFMDYIMDRMPKKKPRYSGVAKLVKAFSVTSNTRALLRVADKSNPDHYALQFLHGMRFLCIGHIVSCHCGQTISDSWSRILNLLIASEEWPYMLLSAGFSSVDTFFFQSGFFLCLSVSRQKNSGPLAFVVGVVRRYIRTAVPMFFVIACLYILPRFVSGPDTKAFFLELYSGMGRYWWYLLLMIRNYAGTNALDVLPHIWYLSTDFQLFAVSLLTLLLFKRRKILAVGAFITLSLLGCAVATWAVANSTMMPFMAFPAPNLHVMDVTMNEYYVRPYYHAICYFSGCITYLLIDDFRNRKISKASQIAGWCISFSCGLCCVFMKLSWYRSQTPPTEAAKLLAAFFDRILWSVFLMWVTLACSTGRGGFVNKLLSWNVFVAPSKLSFGVYLIHLPFIRLSLQASRERLFWSTFNVASMYFSVLAWSYVLAYFTYLVCEAPTTVLDKLAFARITQGRQSVHKQNSKPQLNGIDVKPRGKAVDGVFSRL